MSLVAVSSDAGVSEILREVLCEAGFDLTQVVEYQDKKTVRISVYARTERQVVELKKKLLLFSLKNVKVISKTLKRQEWQEAWKENIKPFVLTKKFAVIPTWVKDQRVPRGRSPIYLNTTLAFGTGLHETTRFVAQLIERCEGKFKSFLDVGTGTGILSIIARRCGAEQVDALDICADSIRLAKQNLAVNTCCFDYVAAIDFKRLKSRKKYDFVAANLVTHDLIAMRSKIVSKVKAGGYLAVSGISLDNLHELKKSFRISPLRCFRVLKGKTWSAILYKRIH